MEETEVVEAEDFNDVDAESVVNPLVYVVVTLAVTAAGLAGWRAWQARRRKNRLAVVESLPAQEESE
jgi:uncharacterized iron-regulated membrane protein